MTAAIRASTRSMSRPAVEVAFDLTADEPGDWAFHCHLLMHMHAGMFNVVTVRPLDGAPA
jgi:FtsP/CotA-like multicopper oxidase with cupredoxin domain